ncbi:MAG TPA: hypothetical protein DCZ75_11125 [Geobacter sp.]|nr:hypothetical protein [Geobacter sp.]
MSVKSKVMLSLLFLILPCLAWGGQSDYLDVTGYASIVDGKKDVARETALQNAFRRAVEQAVGVMVESESVVNNFEMIRDKISSQSAGYIKKYSIVKEGCEPDACTVDIKALVSKAKLEKGLDSHGLLMKKMGKPRIVMLLSEQSVTQDKPSYWWGGSVVEMGVAENTMVSRLLQKDFNFVDRDSILAGLKQEGLSGKLYANISNDMAVKILASGEAEVAIIGQAYAKAGGTGAGGTNFRPCQATVSARAINTDNGEVLASFTTTAMVPHVNPAAGGAQALEKAAGELADKLQKQILEKWKRRVLRSGIVKLVASGLTYEDLREFEAQLRDKIDEVEDVYQRGFSGDTAKMDLEVTGSAKEIAAGISNMEFKGGVVKITSLSANTVELQISKK